ncbi:hypothetical protein MSSAC_1517 [Methanosarcina siciliae C2J]|uniref:Uncharacterized protein n=1 Tax=Methanosarcina siciliae C2J TaxID=1434118 RepID=A0A0E3PMF1_9EURY|nr:hypothetical protein MSSAC_1517 [Methanosarcina siciliae C2J]
MITRGFFEVQEYKISPQKTCPKCGEVIPVVGGYVGEE